MKVPSEPGAATNDKVQAMQFETREIIKSQSGTPWRRAFVLSSLILAALVAGFALGRSIPEDNREQRAAHMVERILSAQREEMNRSQQAMEAHLDALALRVGSLQSSILRINALGERLARRGELDTTEFNFDEEPARGGVNFGEQTRSVEISELLDDLERISLSIDDSEHKLTMMEQLLRSDKVEQELTPSGHPVENGWVSSGYGYRNDPFSGKRAFHRGVDIAGKVGSEVVAVASGVVTKARRKPGFGYLVEIAHADGFITRYAHNSKVLVTEGDLVTKGDAIALMGSSGKSTGPHVHFEIARQGKSLNPKKYLRD